MIISTIVISTAQYGMVFTKTELCRRRIPTCALIQCSEAGHSCCGPVMSCTILIRLCNGAALLVPVPGWRPGAMRGPTPTTSTPHLPTHGPSQL